jgi:hypothetical protein
MGIKCSECTYSPYSDNPYSLIPLPRCNDCNNYSNFKKKEQLRICNRCKYYISKTVCNQCGNHSEYKPAKLGKEQQGTSQTATHYQQADVQPIEIMQMYMTKDQFIGFLKGNVIKYTLRAGHKDNEITDITKARQYLYWFKLALQDTKIEPMKHVLEEKDDIE